MTVFAVSEEKASLITLLLVKEAETGANGFAKEAAELREELQHQRVEQFTDTYLYEVNAQFSDVCIFCDPTNARCTHYCEYMGKYHAQ